ncbi:MAG: hypothetical protein FIB08_16065 [Candidatus Methanoperedens sp.]|nr:hypothetical protein [Candidatus Methanoperedens sp.]
MSEENNIQDRIKIIFDKERHNRYERFHYIENTKVSSQFHIRKKDLELNPSDNWHLEWDTYTALKKLYNIIEKDIKSREIFDNTIKEELMKESCASSLAFYFLLKIGRNKEIIEIIEKRQSNILFLRSGFYLGKEALFNDIQKIMHCEPVYFDDYILDNMQSLNNMDTSSRNPSLDYEIDSIKFSRLQDELEGVNEEINIHKEQVIDIISKFGFSSELGKFLLEIDKTLELPDWESINSGMISNLRAFFEELTKSIAMQIKQITEEEYPNDPKKSLIGNLRAYIKSYLKLSDYDDKLIDGFVNILHKEGGHAFLSERRYFFLAKNIGIEIAYFLLSKLEDLSKEKNMK